MDDKYIFSSYKLINRVDNYILSGYKLETMDYNFFFPAIDKLIGILS